MGHTKIDLRTLDDFEPGERVKYIPRHANGNPHHPDCETGIVLRLGDIRPLETVFVVYDTINRVMTDLAIASRYTAAGTNPRELVKI